MALQTFRKFRWPDLNQLTFTPAITALNLLDAVGEYSAQVINAAEAMVISHIGFLPQASTVGVVTGSIETLTSGNPSGTLLNVAGGGSIGTSGVCVAGVEELIALAAPATITPGQDFAAVIKSVSGSVTTGSLGLAMAPISVPYHVTNTTGSAVKSAGTDFLLSLGSSATTFYSVPSLFPGVTILGDAWNNTNSKAIGVRFQVTAPCRLIGVKGYAGSSAGNHNIVCYDDAGNELSSSSTAKVQANSFNTNRPQITYFDNPIVLAAGTWYKVVFEPSSATNFALYSLVLPSLNYRSAMPGGTNFHYTSRTSGVWTDTTTDTVPIVDLIFDQADDGVQVGGGVVARVIGG